MSERVLVIDDDKGSREVLREILGWDGYAVAVAGDGRESPTQLKRLAPDLIVPDLRSGHLDGPRFLEELRRPSRRSPFSVLANSADQWALRSARRLGLDAYLPKPFELDGLLRDVGRLAGIRGRDRPSEGCAREAESTRRADGRAREAPGGAIRAGKQRADGTHRALRRRRVAGHLHP